MKLSLSGPPQIALTLDDPTVELGSYMHWREANQRILDVLNQRKLKTTLFVCGVRVATPEGRELLQAWNDAGIASAITHIPI